jgi:hypothetical protein
MARSYDNIEISFRDGLKHIINNFGVKRVDFCVGYFNLRGWRLVENEIEQLPGDTVYEDDGEKHRVCRLLIGMQRPPEELIEEWYSAQRTKPDSDYVQRCKRQIVKEFKKQLLIGAPTKDDESTLRRLSQQLKDGKVTVKLYLKEPLHAKLYLAYRPEDYYCPILSILGSRCLPYISKLEVVSTADTYVCNTWRIKCCIVCFTNIYDTRTQYGSPIESDCHWHIEECKAHTSQALNTYISVVRTTTNIDTHTCVNKPVTCTRCPVHIQKMPVVKD